MKHPTPEQLAPLLKAVDTAVWAWSVKNQTRPGGKVRVDWKGAMQDLVEAYGMFELATDDHVLVLSNQDSDEICEHLAYKADCVSCAEKAHQEATDGKA